MKKGNYLVVTVVCRLSRPIYIFFKFTVFVRDTAATVGCDGAGVSLPSLPLVRWIGRSAAGEERKYELLCVTVVWLVKENRGVAPHSYDAFISQ